MGVIRISFNDVFLLAITISPELEAVKDIVELSL